MKMHGLTNPKFNPVIQSSKALLTISAPQIFQSQLYTYFLSPNTFYVSVSPTPDATRRNTQASMKSNDGYVTIHTTQIQAFATNTCRETSNKYGFFFKDGDHSRVGEMTVKITTWKRHIFV
jgi:hypothetical protein